MDEIIKYATIGLVAIGYVWIIAKSAEWFLGLIARKTIRRMIKDRRQKAVNELYDAYDLGNIKQGGDVKIAMKSGLVILIYRQSKE